MKYELDAAVVLLIAVFAFFGYKKGVLKTVISVIGTLLAALISSVLSDPIAEAIYNAVFKASIIGKAESALKLVSTEGGSFLEKFEKTLPKFVLNSLDDFRITPADLSSASANGAAQIERTLAPTFISFISVVISIALFVALLALVKFICAMIYKGMESSPLNFFDSFFGAVIAIAEGFIVVMLAAFIIRVAVPHMKQPPQIISDETISQSVVFKGVYNSPIITELVESVTESPNTEEVE